jgi:hypothetical protein
VVGSDGVQGGGCGVGSGQGTRDAAFRGERQKAHSSGAMSSPPVLLHLHYAQRGRLRLLLLCLHGNARETLVLLVARPPNNHAT